VIFEEGVEVVKKISDQDEENQRDARDKDGDKKLTDQITVKDPHGSAAQSSGEGDVGDSRGARALEGPGSLFHGCARRENIIHEKNRTAADPALVRRSKSPLQVQFSGFPAQQALSRRGPAFGKPPGHHGEAGDAVDLLCQEAGLIELPLEPSPGVQRNRDDAISLAQLGSSLAKMKQRFIKKVQEVPSSSKLNFVKKILHDRLVPEKSPPLVGIRKRKPDLFFRGKQPEFFETGCAGVAEAFFFQLQKMAAGGAEAGKKESQKGFRVKGENTLQLHGGTIAERPIDFHPRKRIIPGRDKNTRRRQ